MSVQQDKLAQVFDAAAELSNAADRAAYLDAACGEDRQFRAEVEELLEHDQAASGFLSKGAQATPDAVGEPPVREGPGTVVGPYKLLEQIGEGGFGVVFMAEQNRPVRRKVALKILKPGMDTRQVVARFEAERQALALMDHPNIAHVFDGGETSNGRPYFVMELVRGIPITEFCDDNQLPVRQRLELFIRICQAVQHAHQKGIIHRDLKPSNIMVTLHDGTPVVKVIDFGIAKAVGQQLTDKTLFTNFAQLMGTPTYMSPEQAQLSGLDTDTRTDIYSLGVLLYELLTSTTPCDKERLRTAAFDEIRRIIREEEPARPSLRVNTMGQASTPMSAKRKSDPVRLCQLLRGELDWIVMKALEKDRNRRYETASAFAADVQRYLDDEPVHACPPSALYRFRKFARRRKAALISVGLVAAALLLGTGVSIWYAVQAGRAEVQAKSQEANAVAAKLQAQDDTATTQAMFDFVTQDVLSQASAFQQAGPGVTANRDLKVREALDRAAERITGKFVNRPHAEVVLRRTMGRTYVELTEYDKAQAQLELSYRLAQSTWGDDDERTRISLLELVRGYTQLGKLSLAEPLANKLVEQQSRLDGEHNSHTLDAWHALAAVYVAQGKYDLAEPVLLRLAQVSRSVLGEEHVDTLNFVNTLAEVYLRQRKHEQAEEILVPLVAARRKLLGNEHPATVDSLNTLGLAYKYQRKTAQAEAVFSEILETSRRVHGDRHEHTIGSMGNLGLVYQDQRKLDRAEELFAQSAKLAVEVFGVDHYGTYVLLHNLAKVHHEQGKLDQAVAEFVKTLNGHRRLLGPDHPQAVLAAEALALVYVDQGKHAQAEPLFAQVAAAHRKKLGAQHPRVAEALVLQGTNLLRLRRFVDAETALREALDIRQAKQPDAWTTFHTRSLLGGALAGQQNFVDAEPLLLQGHEGLRQRAERIAPTARTGQIREAVERLVQLYDAWGKTNEAARWRKELQGTAEKK
jgi:serine/threonine protein kinase